MFQPRSCRIRAGDDDPDAKSKTFSPGALIRLLSVFAVSRSITMPLPDFVFFTSSLSLPWSIFIFILRWSFVPISRSIPGGKCLSSLIRASMSSVTSLVLNFTGTTTLSPIVALPKPDIFNGVVDFRSHVVLAILSLTSDTSAYVSTPITTLWPPIHPMNAVTFRPSVLPSPAIGAAVMPMSLPRSLMFAMSFQSRWS